VGITVTSPVNIVGSIPDVIAVAGPGVIANEPWITVGLTVAVTNDIGDGKMNISRIVGPDVAVTNDNAVGVIVMDPNRTTGLYVDGRNAPTAGTTVKLPLMVVGSTPVATKCAGSHTMMRFEPGWNSHSVPVDPSNSQ
jgi:hypothetical protein